MWERERGEKEEVKEEIGKEGEEEGNHNESTPVRERASLMLSHDSPFVYPWIQSNSWDSIPPHQYLYLWTIYNTDKAFPPPSFPPLPFPPSSPSLPSCLPPSNSPPLL